LGRVGREVLVGDVDAALVPPFPDFAHGRQQHLVDGAVESERLAGGVQRSGDAARGQLEGGLQEGLDQRPG
jgi:hypothetical protein